MNNFRLSMQILYDVLSETYSEILFHSGGDQPQLTGFRLYQPGIPLLNQYVYIITDNILPALSVDMTGTGFLFGRNMDPSLFPIGCPVIAVRD